MRRICALVIGLAMLAMTPGLAQADIYTRTAGNQQAINSVIARGLAQRGVPYTYGGGDANGPTRGVRPSVSEVSSMPTSAIGGFEQTGPGVGALPGLGVVAPAPTPDVVGFDASGLIVYSFAGVGIKLPRSSGEQYKVGRKVLPAQALPGDLIFYGPEGNQSVTMFVGNGQMLEATDPAVVVSPVRTANMTPYLVRIIL